LLEVGHEVAGPLAPVMVPVLRSGRCGWVPLLRDGLDLVPLVGFERLLVGTMTSWKNLDRICA
jgi:hypothetical protein